MPAFGSLRYVSQFVIIHLLPIDREGGSRESGRICSKFSLQSRGTNTGSILITHTARAEGLSGDGNNVIAGVLRGKPHMERILTPLRRGYEAHVFHEDGLAHLASSASTIVFPSS